MPYALLIDDDTDALATRRAVLAGDGWDVEIASPGHVALASMRVRRPDVVLLGSFGEGGQGMAILQDMLLDPLLRTVPRVVISASDSAVARRFALGLGAAAWLSSPVTSDRLLAAAWDHHSDETAEDALRS